MTAKILGRYDISDKICAIWLYLVLLWLHTYPKGSLHCHCRNRIMRMAVLNKCVLGYCRAWSRLLVWCTAVNPPAWNRYIWSKCQSINGFCTVIILSLMMPMLAWFICMTDYTEVHQNLAAIPMGTIYTISWIWNWHAINWHMIRINVSLRPIIHHHSTYLQRTWFSWESPSWLFLENITLTWFILCLVSVKTYSIFTTIVRKFLTFLSFVSVWYWLIYPYSSGLIHCQWGNHAITLVPVM